MKKKILIALLLISTAVLSTPHYPNGIPSIGPLEGGPTFWGENPDGTYFDGVSYGAGYTIDLPNKEKLHLRVALTTYLNGRGNKNEKSIYFGFDKPIEGFTGEINLKYKDKKGANIVRNYKGTLNGKTTYIYNTFFDFAGADEKVKVTMELLLNDDKKITIKLDSTVAKDLITISQLFPEAK